MIPEEFMRRVIHLAKQCQPRHPKRTPRLGVLITRGDAVLAEAHRGAGLKQLLGVLLLFSCTATLSAQQKDGGEPITQRQIEAFVQDLGHKQYAVREKAMKALRALGVEALPALKRAVDSPDAEIGRNAEDLLLSAVKPLRDRFPTSQPGTVTTELITLQIVTDPGWKLASDNINLDVKIISWGPRFAFPDLDQFDLLLVQTAAPRSRITSADNKRNTAPTTTPRLQYGESYVLNYKLKLEKGETAKHTLTVMDAFGRECRTTGLQAGTYKLYLEYKVGKRTRPAVGDWRYAQFGARTSPITINIK